MSVAKKFVNALKASQKKTKPADDDAVVQRIEGGTAWVHIPGGVDETPVQLTIDCRPGETVKVRRANGRAWIVGNGTSPPTDDKKAKQVERELEKQTELIDGDIKKIFKGVNEINTLIRESAAGIEVGKVDRDGEYLTGHTLIDAADNAYKIIDNAGNVVATFASALLQYAREGVITVELSIGSNQMKLQDLRTMNEIRFDTKSRMRCAGTGELSIDADGVADANGGYKVAGNPMFKLIKAHNLETSPMPADSFTANDVKHDITSLVPDGYEILNITVSGTGYNCVNVYRLTWGWENNKLYVLYRLRNFGDSQVSATPYVNIVLINKGLL